MLPPAKSASFSLFAAPVLLAGLVLPVAARIHRPFPPRPVALTFEELPLPETDEELTRWRVSEKVTARYPGGRERIAPLSWHEVLRTGDSDELGKPAGVMVDKTGRSLLDENGRPRISNQVDNNTLHPLPDGRVVLLTHLEDSPGGVQHTLLEDDGAGNLKARRFTPVDISAVGGTVRNCAGSKTPWGTHLASEEDGENDPLWFDPKTTTLTRTHISRCARDANGQFTGGGAPGHENLTGWCGRIAGIWRDYHHGDARYTPYNYGYHVEISVSPQSEARVVAPKRYTLGKGAPEMALVMPDRRTVYITDDGSYRHFLMFVADRAGDLSSGVLFGAKLKQTGPDRATVSWLRLGRGNVSALKEKVFGGLTFSDFWEWTDVTQCGVKKGFRMVKAGDNGPLCLRLRDGQNGSRRSARFASGQEVRDTAAFMETRRFIGWLGGTTEFQKAEALTHDPDHQRLYLAVSNVSNGLEKAPATPRGLSDHLAFAPNKCGAVWAFTLGRDVATGSAHTARAMSVLAQGRPLKPGQPHASQYACDPAAIAGPDNLRYIGANTLLVGEDTSHHLNNMVFAIDVTTGKQTRIATAPFGAEVTGMFAGLEWKGETLLFFNAQAPMGDRVLVNAVGVPQKATLVQNATAWDQAGRVGYLSGLPAGLY